MYFVHQAHLTEDTIAAIATAPGSGGVAIIRLSGECSVAVADNFFSGNVKGYSSHTVHYGRVLDYEGHFIDDALLIPMLNKRSYTGEDIVEIHCHGGPLVTKKILDMLVSERDVRAAGPGEYTMRAFLNGKIDLAQAESVQELISAQSSLSLEAAHNQLQGKLSQKVVSFQEKLINVTAIIEAWVDFPEEGLEYISEEGLLGELEAVLLEIEGLLRTFEDGRKISTGINMALVGSPNVGKSSLMNALLGKDRAIVTEIAGTTRDLLEEALTLDGIHFNLIDTAGIREGAEIIECEGIRRARQAIKDSDLILFVLDASRGFTDFDKALWLDLPADKTICIWNKVDLPHETTPLPEENIASVKLSALEQSGMDLLKEAIDKIIWKDGPPSKGEILITNSRHREALQNSHEAISRAKKAFEINISPEFIALDLRESLQHLGSIIGTNISEDLLSSIFSKFCIGK